MLADPNTLHDWENGVRRSVLWEADGIESSVAVVAADSLAFHLNGMCDGNAVEDVGTQVMLGLIGAALHPRPQTACVVGLGTGETAGWLADVPSIQRVDVVELEPAVREMARRCRQVNRDVLANPKVRLIFNDAREVLLTTAGRYDLIVCEPSNPYRSGIANLFTREFYRAGRDRLNDRGMFVQWVQAYEIDRRTMRTVLATFKSVFPHVEVWQSKLGDLVLVGSQQQPATRLPRCGARWRPSPSPLRCAPPGTPPVWKGCSPIMSAARRWSISSSPRTWRRRIPMTITKSSTASPGRWDAPIGMPPGSCAAKRSELGDQRLPVDGGAVDWKRGGAGAPMGCGGPWRQETLRRGLALNDGDHATRSWNGTSPRTPGGCSSPGNLLRHSPPCLTELAVVAHLYAESGSRKAEPLIDQLGNDMPTEAEALRGILAWRQRKLDEAGRRLAAAITAIAQRSLGAGAYPREDVRRGDRRGQGGPAPGPERCCRRWASPSPPTMPMKVDAPRLASLPKVLARPR